jgi:hypothetical protein
LLGEALTWVGYAFWWDPMEEMGPISIEECRKYLTDITLSDEKILEIRNYLYELAREIINEQR